MDPVRCPKCGATNVRYQRAVSAWYCAEELCDCVFYVVEDEEIEEREEG